jgi:predicted Zn-ribbon and HTH transcriptional regulator
MSRLKADGLSHWLEPIEQCLIPDTRRNSLTIRQRITAILKEGQVTARDLSRLLGITEKEVYHHLPHVERSLRNGVSLIAEPARCLDCGFVFKKRNRLTTPGRCPVCRSEAITAPVYGINAGRQEDTSR